MNTTLKTDWIGTIYCRELTINAASVVSSALIVKGNFNQNNEDISFKTMR